MPTELSIPTILSLSKICQYRAIVTIGNNGTLQGGDLNPIQAREIYMERMAVQNRFSLNPSDSTLRKTANYLFSLLRDWLIANNILNAVAGGKATISNPSNDSVNVGSSATFAVAVSSPTLYTVQWYRNGIAIVGATGLSYTLSNAQLTDSGSTFFATATNAAGTVTSLPATLTVTASLIGFFAYSATTDFYATLITNSDPFSYPTTYSITHNSPIVITLPGAMPANQYMVAKVPIGESIKTIWNNTSLNFGTIPDSVFEAIVQFGGYTYYASKAQVSMDVTQPLTLI